jgi:signal transduction histidine kinase
METMGSTSAGITDRKRVEAVVDTLANIYREGESLAELAHDARNMVTALSLYCDLLEEPGVLTSTHRHYGNELRLVAEASRRLVEKLTLLGAEESAGPPPQPLTRLAGRLFPQGFEAAPSVQGNFAAPGAGGYIENLRDELLADRNLLAAIAGPAITLTLNPRGGAVPVHMKSEDLTRVLVNLVKNAAESVRTSGTIEITLSESSREASASGSVLVVVEDNGPGISPEALKTLFEQGYTTKSNDRSNGNWPSRHQGLGLSIIRSIVGAAGGKIHAENRAQGGARFVIELPIGIR